MKQQIKLVAFDLDGTILNSEKVFTAYTKQVLKRVIEKGVIILPATGRPLTGIPKDIMEFPGIRYAITANGGRIFDLDSDKTLYEKLVPVEIARNVLDIFEHYDTLREVYYNGVGYTEEGMLERIREFLPSSPMADYVRATRSVVDNVRALFEAEQRSLDKVQALFRIRKEKEAALEELRALEGIEITGALSNNIEVNAGGVHKGNALIRLGEKLGITLEEMLVFGDGANDIEMIKMAGVGICMSNGIDAVKAAADKIALSNDENGVATMLEQMILA